MSPDYDIFSRTLRLKGKTVYIEVFIQNRNKRESASFYYGTDKRIYSGDRPGYRLTIKLESMNKSFMKNIVEVIENQGFEGLLVNYKIHNSFKGSSNPNEVEANAVLALIYNELLNRFEGKHKSGVFSSLAKEEPVVNSDNSTSVRQPVHIEQPKSNQNYRRYGNQEKLGVKHVAIILVGLFVTTVFVLMVGVPGLPHIVIPELDSNQHADTSGNSPDIIQSVPTATQTTNAVTMSNCLMVSNGMGVIRINCAEHDSVQCISNPPIGSMIQRDVTLTIDKDSCNVRYQNPQGSTIYFSFQVDTSPSIRKSDMMASNIPATNTQTSPSRQAVVSPQPTPPESNNNVIAPVIIPTKPTISITTLEQEIHVLINQQREQQGLTPLQFDQKLADVAREHSSDMATKNYFEHDTPEGVAPDQRGKSAGYADCGDPSAIQLKQRIETLQKNIRLTNDPAQIETYNSLVLDYNLRVTKGMIFDGIGENIFQNWLYDSSQTLNGIVVSHNWLNVDSLAQTTVSGWMTSLGHRANILTPHWHSEGIGVAISNDDKVLITEDFC